LEIVELIGCTSACAGERAAAAPAANSEASLPLLQ
jgi:hypothetical protein